MSARATIESFAAKIIRATKKFYLGSTEVTATAAELNILDGVIKTTAQINALTIGVAAGYKIARGQHTTVDENDTIVTGLATVVAVIATLDDDPVDGCQVVTASIGNQSGAPAAGSVLIKTWKATAANNSALIAATTFEKKVNWIAVGT
jgi:hypothetical protein